MYDNVVFRLSKPFQGNKMENQNIDSAGNQHPSTEEQRKKDKAQLDKIRQTLAEKQRAAEEAKKKKK